MQRLSKFVLVGLVTNAIGYVIYLILTFTTLTPKITMTVLYCVGTGISFYGNKNITFGDVNKKDSKIFIRYILVYSLGYVLNFLMLSYFVDNLGFPHQLIQALSIFLVAFFLFIMLKNYVFRGA